MKTFSSNRRADVPQRKNEKKANLTRIQDCQMVYFQTKMPISVYTGKPWDKNFGVFHGHFEHLLSFRERYFMAIWYFLWPLRFVFRILVCCTNTYLAAYPAQITATYVGKIYNLGFDEKRKFVR
jgi:hypothetical protein